MLISCNILKKHIKESEKINFLTIWDTFTIRTAEVENVKIKGKNINGIITAKIIESNPHPKSKKLSILKVNDGTEDYSVVCGAPNVKVGLIGAFAKIGSYIDGIEIGMRPILGTTSFGMMCSGKELGISDDHEGIISFPEDTKLGIDLKELLPIEDIIVEIDNKSLTNRPDLWGHYGIAREIAAISGNKLLPLALEEPKNDKKDLNIKIKDPKLCRRYIGIRLEDIKNKTTPMWMQIFLYYTGMRSIDLIVDLTNYIMLELGQPMHAFDSRIVKDIEIGLAKNNDKFTTLDDVKRTLTNKDLMIKNNGEYFAMAGVMGGLDSEITSNTNSIILESANFDHETVRKTATYHALRTEASTRYEKNLDPNLALTASKRFIKLLKEENPKLKISSNLTDVYPEKFIEKEIILNKDLLYKYLGFKLEDKIVKEILTNLEFKVEVTQTDFIIVVPTFRATKDITIPEDLIEEIARMYGYENFEETSLNMDLTFSLKDDGYNLEYEIKEFLVNKYNLNEVHTYLWNKTKFLKDTNINLKNVKLLSKSEDNILRDDLSLSMLEVALVNIKNYDSIGVFEIGTTIINNENEKHLSILLTSDIDDLKTIYNESKNIVYNIFNSFKNLKPIFDFGKSKEYYNNDLTQDIIVNNFTMGQIKVFNRSISNKINKKKSFVVIDLNFDEFIKLKKENTSYQEISKYPTTTLDYTIISKRGEYYSNFDKIINKFTSPLIIKRELIDIYLETNYKKITIRYIIGSNEKTLTNEELQNFKDEFIKFIKKSELSIIEK